MAIVNFRISEKKKRELERKLRQKGYMTTSEFFRQKAREMLLDE